MAALAQNPYYGQPFPKAADRYQFDFALEDLSVADGAATLCALTAQAILATLPQLPQLPVKIYLTGGGAQHPLVRELLAQEVPVALIEEAGLRGDSLEAEAFAWLAVRRLQGLPASVPGTTGCTQAATGGMLSS